MARVQTMRSRPVSTALSPITIDSLRTALLDELTVHQRTATEAGATVEDLTGHDVNDVGAAREMADSTRRHALDVIAQIHAALGRLDHGSYGACERCDEPIAVGRLEAIPYTRTCMACQPSSTKPAR